MSKNQFTLVVTHLVLRYILLLLTFLGLFPQGPAWAYQNPILGPINDPDCIMIDGLYRLIEPQGGKQSDHFAYRTSRDLVHWSAPVAILQQPKGIGLWQGYFFKNADGKLYLYYATVDVAKHKTVHVALAADFTGPFTDLGVVAYNAIDPFLLRDDDGSLWLYFKNDQTGLKSIFVQPMSNPSTVSGLPIEVLHPQPNTFEDDGYLTVEGPSVIKRSGRYFLLYTGGPFGAKSYAVGYAVASTPAGPFQRGPNNPILSNTKSRGVFSPGVPDVVSDGAGKSWLVYRQRQTAARRSPRMLTIDPLDDSRAAEGILQAKATSGTTMPDPTPLP